MSALQFTDVRFAYPGGTAVLEGGNFSLGDNESICVVGPNGGGKSTLVKLALGLLQPDDGEIRVLGTSAAKARRRIGYMPQYLNFDSRFPITVTDVVLMGRLRGGLRLGPFVKADRVATGKALARVDLTGVEKKRFSDLSGGQRQRVLIARALVDDPQLLLLDEPTANVDQTIEQQFHDTLRDLAGEMAIVLVSHDLGFVSSWVKHVLCVNRHVHMHPTASIDGKTLREIFGQDIVAVRHDHDCPPGDHVHHHDDADCGHDHG